MVPYRKGIIIYLYALTISNAQNPQPHPLVHPTRSIHFFGFISILYPLGVLLP